MPPQHWGCQDNLLLNLRERLQASVLLSARRLGKARRCVAVGQLCGQGEFGGALGQYGVTAAHARWRSNLQIMYAQGRAGGQAGKDQ